jgi:hypothetical protein
MPKHSRSINFDAFADESGVRRVGLLEGLSGIWIPPRADLALIDTKDRGAVSFVVYPVTEALNEGLENLPWPYGRGGSELMEADWMVRDLPDADSLVEDFVALADAGDDVVRYFAQEYGPLWICVRHVHFWTPASPENIDKTNPDPNTYCLWVPREEVGLFRTHAIQLKACLEIAECLADPPSKAPATHFDRLYGPQFGALVSKLPSSQQRDHMATVLAGYILNWVTPWVTWDREPRPKLTFQTGLGFMGLAWLQAAQLIAGGVDMRTCSGCHRFYFRRERKPPQGWNNFCDECRGSEGSKISKKLHARKKRKEQRDAKAQASTKRNTTKKKE